MPSSETTSKSLSPQPKSSSKSTSTTDLVGQTLTSERGLTATCVSFDAAKQTYLFNVERIVKGETQTLTREVRAHLLEFFLKGYPA